MKSQFQYLENCAAHNYAYTVNLQILTYRSMLSICVKSNCCWICYYCCRKEINNLVILYLLCVYLHLLFVCLEKRIVIPRSDDLLIFYEQFQLLFLELFRIIRCDIQLTPIRKFSYNAIKNHRENAFNFSKLQKLKY